MAGNVSGERRDVPWTYKLWAVLMVLGLAAWIGIATNQKDQIVRLTRALAARPGGVDTVYVERYWGMTYHTTKPGGVLVVEFQQVKTGGKE
jgi:hypothetical protein